MRVASYCRVSKAEQVEGYSLASQRFAIERFCRDRGYEIVAHYADEGISAKHEAIAKRPGFKDALDCVERGQADAIAVHKLDRFARNARVFHEALHRLRNKVIFVDEGFDPNSAVGELMAGVMAQFAQFFSRNLGNEVRKGLEGRRRQGLYNGGPLPFGVCKDPSATDPRRAVPIPDTTARLCTLADRREWSPYDALRLIYQRASEGVSAIKISNELSVMGFDLTPPGIRHILMNRFYLGEIPISHAPHSPHATQYMPGAHQPILERALWEAANVAIRSMPCLRRVNSVRKGAQTWSLTGLLTCGRCHGPMHVKSHKEGTRAECARRYKLQRCDQPSFSIHRIQPQVEEVVAGLVIPEEVVRAIEERFRPERRDVRREIRSLQGQRNRLNELYIEGALAKEQYLERAARIESRLADLDLRIEPREPVPFAVLLRDLPRLYREATEEQRNRLLRIILEGLMVDNQTIVAIRPQPKLAALLGCLPPNVESAVWRSPP